MVEENRDHTDMSVVDFRHLRQADISLRTDCVSGGGLPRGYVRLCSITCEVSHLAVEPQ